MRRKTICSLTNKECIGAHICRTGRAFTICPYMQQIWEYEKDVMTDSTHPRIKSEVRL